MLAIFKTNGRCTTVIGGSSCACSLEAVLQNQIQLLQFDCSAEEGLKPDSDSIFSLGCWRHQLNEIASALIELKVNFDIGNAE